MMFNLESYAVTPSYIFPPGEFSPCLIISDGFIIVFFLGIVIGSLMSGDVRSGCAGAEILHRHPFLRISESL